MQNSNNKRVIWQAPWGYPESFAIVGGLVVIGVILQFIIGSFDFYLLSSPVNYGVLITLLHICIGLGFLTRKSSLARWLSGVPISVALVSAMLVMSIIMGLTPQSQHPHTTLGFDTMTSNWSFVLVYTLLIISLGVLITRRLLNFRLKDIPFHLNHIGLWLLLTASGLGYADMQRYIMYVNEGETEWRVYDSKNNIEELPIAITLNDFSMEFYPSRRVIIERESGKIQHGDSTDYPLGERYAAVMTAPEPRSFSSDVEVYTKDGDAIKTSIEVNNPLRIGSWTIYQYGYDNAAGNRSKYSSFELVYDSWIIPVYIGIILMMLGSVSMIWSGRKIGGANNDVE